MRRSVETCLPRETGPFSKSSEEGLDECTRAPFAFGPCDMNNVKLVERGGLGSVSKVLNSAKDAYRVTDLLKPLVHSDYARSTPQVCLRFPICITA